ncbi:bromodomain-containing protein 8-like [Echinops telfairi]|uniref:Bromodomain-containing protein 8-like n=1 Tax=Echinops telfairi TaxID=9371 RepID=A0AC55CQQ4_ECHTE|nr:bromodomain-containing protein 8-like [Echinops telfairi]
MDLDVGSWRETEEPGAEELEESSPGREPSEPLGDGDSEESQEETVQVRRQNLLHFLSEVAYLMEPLSISSNESTEGCCPPSATRQQKGKETEAAKEEREPCREAEELSAKLNSLVAEKKPVEERGEQEVEPAPSGLCAVQELSTENEECLLYAQTSKVP